MQQRSLNCLAISGSLRDASTNTALLQALIPLAQPGMNIDLCQDIGGLPIFNPDYEGKDTPDSVLVFARKIANADGLIFSSPEYVHGIPGGLKNALDWLVSRSEIPGKPVMLAHASQRGDIAWGALIDVLQTVSQNVVEQAFLRVDLMGCTTVKMTEILGSPVVLQRCRSSLQQFEQSILTGLKRPLL